MDQFIQSRDDSVSNIASVLTKCSKGRALLRSMPDQDGEDEIWVRVSLEARLDAEDIFDEDTYFFLPWVKPHVICTCRRVLSSSVSPFMHGDIVGDEQWGKRFCIPFVRLQCGVSYVFASSH